MDSDDESSAAAIEAKKKRTRPVSACEPCRAHKVKCILKPDQPVCQRCAASGKDCLFRIDDLRPDFRAERFSHLGPPGKDAREIKSKPKQARKSETSPDEPVAGSSKRNSTSRDTERTSGDSVAKKKPREEDPVPYRKTLQYSAESVYIPPAPAISYPSKRQSFGSGLPYSRSQVADVGPLSNGTRHAEPAAPSYHRSSASAYSPIAPEPYYTASSPPSRGMRPGDIGFFSPHSVPFGHSDTVGMVPSSSASYQQYMPAATAFAGSPGGFRASTSSRSDLMAMQPPPPKVSPYAPHNPSPGRHSVISPSSSLQRGSLPPIQMAPPAYRSEGSGPSGSSLRDGRRRDYISTSGVNGANAVPGAVLSSRLEDKARQGRKDRPTTSVVSSQNSDASSPRTSVHGGSQSSRASSQRKATLVVPFFRWFGLTANTPGYRRIKVAVNPDLPSEESEEAQNRVEEIADNQQTTPAQSDTKAAKDGEGGTTSPMQAKEPPDTKVESQLKTDGNSSGRVEASKSASSSIDRTPFSRLAGVETDSIASASTRELFDPSRPRYPRTDILIHLTELFLSHFRCNLCPWIDDSLLEGAKAATLPAILANSICAVTARFSPRVELTSRPVKSVAEPFSEMAKALIVPLLSWPSLDVIEALVILSHAEFAAGSDSGLWMWSGSAMRMAIDLGLQHESTILSLSTIKEQEKARWLFWAGCYAVDRITCFGTGRPVTISEHIIDCHPPSPQPDAPTYYASQIIQILMRRGRMGELLNRANDGIQIEDKKARLMEMWTECAAYFQNLPQSCAFGIQSFKRAASNNTSPAFLFLHVLFQSVMSLLERPELMRGREIDMSRMAAPNATRISSSVSRSIVDMLSLAAALDPKALHGSPYLDQLILPAARVFIYEREAVQESLRQCGYQGGISRPVSPSSRGASRNEDERLAHLLRVRKAVTDNLSKCIAWLSDLADYWGGASWPARALEQEAAGAQDVEPDARDDDAMQAPLRDMELLASWAKDKLKQARGKVAYRRVSGGDHPVGVRATDGRRQTGPGGDMASPLTSPALANLLSAANAAGSAGSTDSSFLPDDHNPLGLGLSGQLNTMAEIDIQALVELWASQQNGTDAGAPNNRNATVASTSHHRPYSISAAVSPSANGVGPRQWPHDAAGPPSMVPGQPSTFQESAVNQPAPSLSALWPSSTSSSIPSTALAPSMYLNSYSSGGSLDFGASALQLEQLFSSSSHSRNGHGSTSATGQGNMIRSVNGQTPTVGIDDGNTGSLHNRGPNDSGAIQGLTNNHNHNHNHTYPSMNSDRDTGIVFPLELPIEELFFLPGGSEALGFGTFVAPPPASAAPAVQPPAPHPHS